jgi:S-methylmethionine-dependent homocysteine/selenocysteine methylase
MSIQSKVSPITAPGSRRSAALRAKQGQSLETRLSAGVTPIRLDGATGTELERRGVFTGLPLWSTHALIDAPEAVGEVHASYVRAGAEMITANTFRTQARTLARAGLEEGADRRLTRLALSLARDAAHEAERASSGSREEGRRCWIAGSLPPLEDCYAPERVPDARSLEREHGRQAELLAEGGADLILIETMNSLREAEAACRAAQRTGLPFIVGFVAWTRDSLLSGESLSDSSRHMLELGARAVGVNCFPPSLLSDHLEVLGQIGGPLWVAPNLGTPDEATGFLRSEERSPSDLAESLAPWLARRDLRLVGGCCGTGPEHVRAIAARLEAAGPPNQPA